MLFGPVIQLITMRLPILRLSIYVCDRQIQFLVGDTAFSSGSRAVAVGSHADRLRAASLQALGVPVGTSKADVKKAYRKMAVKWHPVRLPIHPQC